MKKVFLLTFMSLNVWPITLDEMGNLEKLLGNDPIVPSNFIQGCYELIAKEDNPKHVKLLSMILDTAEHKGHDEVLKTLKECESVIKSE